MLNHWEIEVINNKRGNKMILFNGHIYNMHRKKLTFIFGVKKKHVKVFLARSLEFMIENLVNHITMVIWIRMKQFILPGVRKRDAWNFVSGPEKLLMQK